MNREAHELEARIGENAKALLRKQQTDSDVR